MFFGLVPALLLLQAASVTTDLKSGERGSSRGARRIYSVLVAGEVALACALLVSSALLVRTVAQMMETPTGVSADNVLTTTVQLSPDSVYSRVCAWRALTRMRTSSRQIRRQPGRAAAGAAISCRSRWAGAIRFGIEGQPPPARPEDAPQAQMHSVSEGYFEAHGRGDRGGPRVHAVRQRRRRRRWSSSTNVREALSVDGRAVGRIVRIRRDRHRAARLQPDASATAPPPGTHCRTAATVRDRRRGEGRAQRAARSGGGAGDVFHDAAVPVPRAVPRRASDRSRTRRSRRCATGCSSAAPNVPMAAAQTWGERFAKRTAEPRLLMTILVFFGALAAPARRDRRLRTVLVVGRAAHARARDSADARRQARERRQPGRAAERGARGRGARRRRR